MISRADPSSSLGVPPDFDTAHLREGMPSLFMDRLHEHQLDLVEAAFEAHHPERTPPDPEPRIPRIIHQIWIGGPLPDEYRRYREGWMELHPEWEHRLWTDERIDALDFEERDLYDGAWNASMKSNILRAVLVRRFGGLHIDVDYECLRPLDPFHHQYDFYATFRGSLGPHCLAPWAYPDPFVVCSSLFAARPGHPVMDAFLSKVRRLWPHRNRLPRFPLERMASVLDRDGSGAEVKRNAKIGYLPFHAEVMRHLAEPLPGERSVVLPPSYFNPVDTFWNGSRFLSPTFWGRLLRYAAHGGAGVPAYYDRPRPHTFAVHHSAASWL